MKTASLFAALALVSGLGLGSLSAQTTPPPNLLHMQLRLSDSVGTPLSGGVDVELRVYDDALAGTLLWSELHAASAANGLVDLLLGSVTPFPTNLFAGSDRFLAVKVGTDPEMTPRVRIASVPFALHAASAVEADDVPGKDITPNSVAVNGTPVIDAGGNWVGPSSG
ncbi:MAG: hypothetical protein AAF682_24180, partial [Planctomycetota bacterium]